MMRFFKDWKTLVVGASIGIATVSVSVGKMSENAYVKVVGALATIGFAVAGDQRKNNHNG